MKRMIVLVFLLISAVNLFALRINEFIVTPTGSEAVELYNETGSSVDVNGYKIYVVGTSTTDSTTFKSFTISAGGYRSFAMDTANFAADKGLPNDGAIIKIYNTTGTLLDSVGYGDLGSAPVPIYNFSCARVSDTGDNADDFNMDWTPSMGAVNSSVASPGLGTGSVFINEVFASDTFDSVSATVEFIELYNNSNTSVDIGNWVIVCDDDYNIPSSTMIPAYGYYVLYDTSFPQFFYLDAWRDNIYLYTGTGVRLDQVGWNALNDSVGPDSSFAVRPNGVRTYYKGYNMATSPDFEPYVPTPGAVNPVEEIYVSSEKSNSVKVASLSNVGILIEASGDARGTLEIIDINGRVIFKSAIKNMVFDTKAGTYFVKTLIDGNRNSVKVDVIK